MSAKKKAKNDLSISLVICTKNRVQDLRDCFDSIIHQTHSIDEIIISITSDSSIFSNLSIISIVGYFITIPTLP